MIVRRNKRFVARIAAAVLVCGGVTVGAGPAVAQAGATQPPGVVTPQAVENAAQYKPTDNYTAVWSRAQALKVRQDPTNTSPRIPADFPVMTDQVWVWDTWPLADLATNVVTYRGWHVIFSLTAPRNIFFGDRHWVARIGFFYSRDGLNWNYGGLVFPPGSSLGSREWAGSAVLLDNSQVQMFYTASGHDNGGVNPNDPLQRLATASGRIHADNSHVWFTGFTNHKIIAEPDGRLYQTLEQSQAGPIIYAFRDPWVFRNPADGKVYLLFEGNTGGTAGAYQCNPRDIGPVPPGHVVPPDARFYTGNIGLAQATTSNLRNWRLLPPLLSANCSNQQVERPHMVITNGHYYLFTISHMFTFAPGLTGPDGVYGFLGTALRSNFQPLNGSALVLGNPADAPLQQYSHFVMRNWLVESFIDTVPLGNGQVRYGGTLAPTLKLTVQGANTYMTGVFGYGYIPATR
jgi:levansucrase